MKMFVSSAVIVAALILLGPILTAPAFAHPGGLNAAGCHAGSRPYYCHRSRSEMVVTSDGRNRLRCDLGSRSQECRSSSPRAVPVLNVQIQLRRHCQGLPAGFADGVWGPQTQQAMVRFQRAYGLVPDGVYGPATASALARSPNGRC